jgi:hypothetical protein
VVVKVGIFPEEPFGSVMVVTTLGGVVVGMYPLGAVLGGIGLWVLGMYADISVLKNDMDGGDPRERWVVTLGMSVTKVTGM